jgi:hypothetical protein
MAARGVGFQRILEKYFPGTRVRKEDRVAIKSSGDEGSDLNAKDAKVFDSFEDHMSWIWKADLVPGVIGVNPVARLTTNPKFLTISSEHFRVTYPAGVDRRDANQVLSTLDSARADFLRRASAASIPVGDLPLLEIRLNDSTGDFTARTGQPWWAAAATKGNRIELQPVAILKRRGVLVTTLRHELAHVVIDKAGSNRSPRWLEEGFAIYLAGEGPMISHYISRGALSTEELEKRLARPGSQQEMRALYAQAYTDVFYLVRNNGEASVWKKLAAA